MAVTAERSGQETKEAERARKQGKDGKGMVKRKGKDKLNSVESGNWQEHVDGWLEAGTTQPHREQDEEHVDGWWKIADEPQDQVQDF